MSRQAILDNLKTEMILFKSGCVLYANPGHVLYLVLMRGLRNGVRIILDGLNSKGLN